jgi:hypothetical protein
VLLRRRGDSIASHTLPLFLPLTQKNIGLYFDASSHGDATLWAAVPAAVSARCVGVFTESHDGAMCLQFLVFSATAIRLAALLQFIDTWMKRGRAKEELALAWLRYQLDGGPVVFLAALSRVLESTTWQGASRLATLADAITAVTHTWSDVVSVSGLRPDTVCSVAVDEAQVLVASYPDGEHGTVRSFGCAFPKSARLRVRRSHRSALLLVSRVRCVQRMAAVVVVSRELSYWVRVIVSGTAMTLGLHSRAVSGVAKHGLQVENLGSRLSAWTKDSAATFLRNFVVDEPFATVVAHAGAATSEDGRGLAGAGTSGTEAPRPTPVAVGAQRRGYLDVCDQPGLFPCTKTQFAPAAQCAYFLSTLNMQSSHGGV